MSTMWTDAGDMVKVGGEQADLPADVRMAAAIDEVAAVAAAHGSGSWTGRWARTDVAGSTTPGAARSGEVNARRGPAGPRPRGACSVCGAVVAVRKDGAASAHGAAGNPCTGSYLPIAGSS